MRRGITPLGAVVRGAIAGGTGALAQTLFFNTTESIAPTPPEGAFEPPDPLQESEGETETVARRAYEGLFARGELSERAKPRAGLLVHVGFGASWGALYGLAREQRAWWSTPLGVLAYSTTVWMVSDNVIVPTARLAGPATRYPFRSHAYAWAAHVVYGVALAASYGAMRPRSRAVVRGAAIGAALWWRLRRLPKPLRPAFGRVVHAGAGATRRLRAIEEGLHEATR